MCGVIKKIQTKLSTKHIIYVKLRGEKNMFRQNKMRENEGVAVCAVLIGATLAATVKVYAMRCVTVQLSDPLHV